MAQIPEAQQNPGASGDLRQFISGEWQDTGTVSHEIYKALGLKIRPARLATMLQASYPDVLVEGPLIRLQAVVQ